MASFTCAHCQNEAKAVCQNCKLVLYCDRNCQSLHWGIHKKDCRSKLGKDTWQPAWAAEGRLPAFMMPMAPAVSFGKKKFLWGNTPAYDILNLEANEGAEYDAAINLLFAASGDLRNVVKTVAAIPEAFRNEVSITMNDKDLDIVARNAILLLVAFCVEDAEEAVDCMIHVWYSAMITGHHAELLKGRLRPMVAEVCSKITEKAPGSIQAKTWTFARGKLRLVLKQETWMSLLLYFDTPASVTLEIAHLSRKMIVLAEERQDYRDRALFKRQPMHRICNVKFREDGILLPFGHSREDFNRPNPTFFSAEGWPMLDSADPLNGWPGTEVWAYSYGLASNDIYGSLFLYLKEMLLRFHHQLRTLRISFDLLNVNAQDLSGGHIKTGSFTRIEASNISDKEYLGVRQTLSILTPFLQSREVNPHATLLTLFMNAIPKIVSRIPGAIDKEKEFRDVLKYMSRAMRNPVAMMAPGNPSRLRADAARALVRDNDHCFAIYTKLEQFDQVEQSYAMRMRSQHTIVDKWPMRLKKKPDEAGAEKEFMLLLGSSQEGNSRYVEWERSE